MNKLTVIGGGLAGCEAAYAAANRGIEVELLEMKPAKKTAAHKSDYLAELVCSNSLKAARVDSAAGLLKEEMRRLGSVCLAAADRSAVAAGGALAVDRDIFSRLITEKIKNHPNITVTERLGYRNTARRRYGNSDRSLNRRCAGGKAGGALRWRKFKLL